MVVAVPPPVLAMVPVAVGLPPADDVAHIFQPLWAWEEAFRATQVLHVSRQFVVNPCLEGT